MKMKNRKPKKKSIKFRRETKKVSINSSNVIYQYLAFVAFILVSEMDCQINCRLLKNIIQAINVFLPQVNVSFSKSGLSITAIDTAHVCLVCCSICPTDFVSYKVSKTTVIGLRTDTLLNTLNRIPDKSVVSLKQEDDDLVMTSGNIQGNIKLLELQQESLDVPWDKLIVDCSFTWNTSDFHNFVCCCKTMGSKKNSSELNSFVIKYDTEQGCGVKAPGADLDLYEKFSFEDNSLNLVVNQNGENSFAAKFVYEFSRCKLSDQAILQFLRNGEGGEFLLVKYEFGAKKKENSFIKYLLASKIKDEA
jgi:Proliferating cell nuclear antigen, N-terminal domain